MRIAFVILLVACTPYDPSLPAEPFLCGSDEPKCPDGYTCMADGTGNQVCATMPGSGSMGSGSCTKPFTGTLATWDFTAAPGSQNSTAVLTAASGVTAGPVSRSTNLMPTDGANSINSSGWPSNAQRDDNTYYTLLLTPPAGCAIAATGMMIDASASSTGPANASVSTSADSFAATAAIATSTPTSPTLSATATTALEIRVYGFAAQATTGTLRIQNKLIVTGALQ